MKAKVKKFEETADPSAAASMQSKMAALTQRFSSAREQHRQKTARLEQHRDKVEEFERAQEKVQSFVAKRSQELLETDGPGRNVHELSQLMEVSTVATPSCILDADACSPISVPAVSPHLGSQLFQESL